MERRIARAVKALPNIELQADASEPERKLEELRTQLQELRDKKIGVDLDAATARARIQELKGDFEELARKSPNVAVSVDAARASTELAAVEHEVSKLDGRNAKVDVSVGGNASWMLPAISAAALGISAAVVPGTAALAALSTVGMGAAATAGTLFAAFKGVGDGVKALDAYQKQTGASAVSSAAQQVSAANSIASAQDQVRSAIRGVDDARRSADIANANSARQVQSAINGQISAEQALGRAEESLTSAQRQELTSQRALITAQLTLTEARKAAQRQLEDLAAQTKDGALAERQATLDIKRAKQELDAVRANPAATELERQQAQLTYDQAVQHLDDQKLRNKQLAEDKAAADKAGVEGSKQVTQAQQGVATATQGVQDAHLGVAHAITGVGDAQRGVAQAADALRVAQAGQAETQRQGLENIAKAQEQVVQSQRSLQTALAQSGAQGSQAIGTLAYAMSQLSPAGQQFAHFLHDEMIPGLHGVRDSVQAALLPQLEVSLRNLGTLTPELTAGLTQTANVIGDLAVRGSMMATSGPWRADFATIMLGNNRALSTFGTAGLSVMDMMRNLAVEAVPLVQRIADLTQRLTAQGAAWLQTKRDTGELAQFFKDAGDELMTILHAAGQVTMAAIQLSQALAPLGFGVVSLVGDLASLIGWLSRIDPLLAQVVVGALGAVPLISRLGSAFDVLGGIWKGMSGTGIASAIEGAALSAGVATEKFVGYAASSETAAAAGGKVAAAGEKVSGALGKLGSALPVIGVALIGLDIAWSSAITSLDDGTRAMLEGGAAAEKMKVKVDDQLTGFGNWLNGMLHFSATSQDMVDAMHKQLDAMDPLHRAQAEAAQAQADYLFALSKGPAGAADAADAQRRYADATAEAARQNRLMNTGLISLTDALNAQRDAFLGSLDGEIRYKDAAAAITRSIQDNGRSVDLNTDAGRRNISTWEEMARSALANIDSMTKQGATQDDITAKAATYRRELFDSAIQIGMTRDQAQHYVDTLHLGVGLFPATMALQLGMSQIDADRYVNTLHGGMGIFPAQMTLDTSPATIALQQWIRSADSQRVVLQVSADTSRIAPPRASGGIDVRPMAGGGFRASVVPANTPTLIGDHPYVPESYIPWDNSASSRHITDITAASQGRQVVPMAFGGTVGTDTGGVGSTADLFATLTDSAENLAKAGLKPLADVMTDTTVPALQQVQQSADRDTPDALKVLTNITTDSGGQMGQVWDRIGRDVTVSTEVMRRSMLDWQALHDGAWADMTARSNEAVGQITGPQMGALHGGLDAIAGHATRTADWWGGQMGRLVPLTGDPVRWSLQFPLNQGLVPAWNSIDRFFALNRPMGPVPIGFDIGGKVPGSGSGDIVPAMLEPDEFVISKPVARSLGLANLTRWHDAARRDSTVSTEGMFRVGFEQGGAVGAAANFARQQVGKPYVWGAVGPDSYDCSGLWSSIISVALGQAPYRRLFTTDSFSPGHGAAGLVPGLSSALGVGVQQGHMAGTLAGTAFEATPPRVLGPGARGATTFPMQFSLPQAGGVFVEGPGGAGFDVVGYLDKAFADARRMAGDVQRFFGPGNIAVGATRVAEDAIAGARAAALAQINATGAGGGGGNNRQIGQRMAAAWGWVGPQWPALDELWRRESGWNEHARNPSSGAYGIPQSLPAEKLASAGADWRDNPATQIRWGLDYIGGRYGNPAAALAWHNGHNWYDQGGLWPSGTFGANLSGRPERVLSPQQTEAFDRLVTILGTLRGLTLPTITAAAATSSAVAAAQGAVEKHYHLTVYDAANNRIDLETQFRRLELSAGIG